jgi:oligopeptide transport system ATP-binding protein
VFDGRPLLDIDASGMQAIRGKQIALVSQDPLTSLNPVMTIGAHLKEILRRHTGLRGQAAKQRSAELLRMVGIPDPEARLAAYPYQLSGGMRQRVVMALALSCEPKLIIADEPTTALDVTIQAQILELLGDLRERLGTSIVLVSHDLGVVAGLADRVMVMYGGTVIEEGQAEDVLVRPLHPYTIGLIASRPELDGPREARLTAIPGASPRLMEQPRGCVFAPRCQHRMPVCAQTPALAAASNGDRRVACWLHAPAADEERHAEC